MTSEEVRVLRDIEKELHEISKKLGHIGQASVLSPTRMPKGKGTISDVIDGMSEDQQKVLYYLVGHALNTPAPAKGSKKPKDIHECLEYMDEANSQEKQSL